jgi:hypothetical protein
VVTFKQLVEKMGAAKMSNAKVQMSNQIQISNAKNIFGFEL